MEKKALERVRPEDVGIASADVLRYIEELEASGTELHGIMIARRGKVCAEGWWAPFSPQLIHGAQSLTKAYVTTGIGILVTEGRLDVDWKVVELLPEYMPENPCENLKKLRVRDLLCMGSGMRQLTDGTVETWIEDFFALDFPDEPGTVFWYSGIITSILGVIISKLSGQGLMEFLTARLFDKIGIDAKTLKWLEHPGGQEYGGGGLFTHTEDNLRLGMLYLQGGVWDGERILSEAWVREATSRQIDNSNGDGAPPTDETAGYGFQIWLSKIPGNYMFWGAHGQFVIMIPRKELVISIHEFVGGPEHRPDEPVLETGEKNGNYRVFNRTWEFSDRIGDVGPLAERGEACHALTNKLCRLCLPARACGPVPDGAWRHDGARFALERNEMSIIPGNYGNTGNQGLHLSHKLPVNIEEFTLKMERGEVIIDLICAGRPYSYRVGTDGIARVSHVRFAHDLPDMVLGTGVWNGADEFVADLRFIETCYLSQLTLHLGARPEVNLREYALFSKSGWQDTHAAARRL